MEQKTGCDESRRGFIKKLAFVPPAIVTLSAMPSIASAGSPRFNKDKKSYKKDYQKSSYKKSSYSKSGKSGKGKGGYR